MTAPSKSSGSPSASGTVHIQASPDVVYQLLTDLPTLTALAEEAEAMQFCKGDSVSEGAVFVGCNVNGDKRWTTKCTVTDAQPGRIFAFEVRFAILPVSRWQYDITAADGGCRVTESTWDRRPGWFRKLAGRSTGVSDRVTANTKNIQLTLERLKQRAEAA